MKIINQKKLGIVVVMKNNYIAGLVTDGDLRREKFISKKTNLQKLMTKNPFIVDESMPATKALGIMSEKKITSLLVASDKDFSTYSANNLTLCIC